ncbi:MAG: mannose-1-phosphate guanylyltransferase, partial [Candidatus Paceibacteria bacterium]
QQTPKQFQRLLGDKTMLQESVERLFPDFSMSDIYVATHEAYSTEVQTELPDLPAEHILTEPEKRDTAAGLGLAGWRVPEVIAFLPADHYVGNPEEFRRVLLSGQIFLSESPDTMVTVGITPHTPETGYGYIKYTSPEWTTQSPHAIYPVEAFTEKPDEETALSYLRHGGYVWNAGIFLTTKTHLQHVYRTHVPQMAQTLDAIGKEQDHQRVKELYTQVEKISFDYAILEHTDALAVIPAEFGWSDIGSWKAVK